MPAALYAWSYPKLWQFWIRHLRLGQVGCGSASTFSGSMPVRHAAAPNSIPENSRVDVLVVKPSEESLWIDETNSPHIGELAGIMEFYVRYMKNVIEDKGLVWGKWADRFWDVVDERKLIVRTVKANKVDYLAGIEDSPHCDDINDAIALEQIASGIPDHFWLLELSIPEVYTVNDSKLADIIVDPAGGDIDSWVSAVRLPGVFSEVKDNREYDHQNVTLDRYYKLYGCSSDK